MVVSVWGALRLLDSVNASLLMVSLDEGLAGWEKVLCYVDSCSVVLLSSLGDYG